jgi:hypothetical protein
MLELAARLACRGPVSVLDGGDRFQAHMVARSIRRYLPSGAGLTAALERTLLARAFTCYQMLTLLDEYPDVPGRPSTEEALPAPGPEAEALPPACPLLPPTLVLDLLATFYDENVSLIESRRLLELCIKHLNRLAARAPLAVSIRPPRPRSDRLVLVERLEAETPQVYRLEPPSPPEPPRLF